MSARRRTGDGGPRRGIALLVVAAAVLVAAILAVWPVCLKLPPEQLTSFQPPIPERRDAYLFGRTFQQREGQWYQCKTRIARALFF